MIFITNKKLMKMVADLKSRTDEQIESVSDQLDDLDNRMDELEDKLDALTDHLKLNIKDGIHIDVCKE
jgi:predicted nuclease with TOPRIM domain